MKKKKIIKACILCIALLAIWLTKTYIIKDNEFPKWQKGSLQMYVIDVGQADSALFLLPDGKTMLIDAGNRDDTFLVENFINSLGIEKLDFVIATHPHEDHIGGMCGVIENFEIGIFYMPHAINTTSYFENMLDLLNDNETDLKIVNSGMMIDDEEYKIEFLSPKNREYEDLNHASIVTKVSYKDTSFLVMGDAEKTNEYDIMETYGESIESDVLKIGHHGSNTSSAKAFLEAVNPKQAIISCGKDNDYGHPHKEVMERLNALDIPVLRTDISGTIMAESDGKYINYITERDE